MTSEAVTAEMAQVKALTKLGAVERLASDLYGGDAHWMLEHLQNCDDCSYAQNTEPSLTITLEADTPRFSSFTSFQTRAETTALLVLEHNEKGFEEQNVQPEPVMGCDWKQCLQEADHALPCTASPRVRKPRR